MNTRGVAFALLAVLFFVPAMIPPPPEDQVVPAVDLGAVVDEMGRDLTYQYDLIQGAELATCAQVWEAEVPYGVRDIFRLGGGNLLVVSRSNRSQTGCEARGKTGDDEEILSVYGPDGSLLDRRSLGARWIARVYTSMDGNLASLVTGGYNDEVQNIVIDQNGMEHFTAEDGKVLFPSPSGEYLVNRTPHAEPGRIEVDIISPIGKRRHVDVGGFLNKDGSRLIDMISAELNRKPGQVLWDFDEKILFAWIADTGGMEPRYDIALLDFENNTVVWQKRHHQLSNQPAVYSQNAEDQFILLQYTNNEEGFRNAVVAAGSGETMGRTTGGSIRRAVGSEDGYFYASVTGRLKIGSRFRRFFVKFSPQLRVIRHGLLYDGYSLHEAKELDGYVWGIHQACTLDDVCYPVMTAIYDMRGDPPSGESGDVISTRVRPVLLEGFWFIDGLTDDTAVLIGQLDPRGGVFKKVVVDRAWIDGEGR